MSILFYDHLVDKREIEIHLIKLELPLEKQSSFKTMIDEIVHHGILELILQKLHPHHHHHFLKHVEQAPYDPELITYLKQQIHDQIEEEIEIHSRKIIRSILADLQSPT